MQLGGHQLTLTEVAAVAYGREIVQVLSSAQPRILASRKVIDNIVARDAIVYGVNTGFGKLADVRIEHEELCRLQLNLVRSHACGIGPPLSEPEVRAMMLLRANVLTLGFSGVRSEIVQMLCEMLNRGVHPVIPEKGSVGASGDLAPLAHLALGLIGEGESFLDGEPMHSSEALQRAGLKPIELQAKEGLALLNGTQAMHAVGGLSLLRARRLTVGVADVAGAMTLEGLRDTPAAFDSRLHDARPHPGQKTAASHLVSLLEGSEIRESHRKNDPRVQDAYSIRCMPQVHGAVRDALAHCEDVLLIESASATDNPLVFENGDVISGGNFHGAPLALALDYAGIGVVDLMNISERRIDRLVNPGKSEGLPAFLARRPGLQSGFMIPHVAAASLVNEARVLAHPASVDNITTSGGKEDHVSMGMTSALKLRSIVDLAENLFAIELLAGAEALEHRRPLKAGRGVERAFEIVRQIAPPLTQDRPLSHDIAAVAKKIRNGSFDEL